MTLKRSLVFLAAFFILLPAGYLLLRNYILEKAISELQQKVLKKYGARLTIGEAGFERMARVRLEDISLLPPHGDTLFYCKQAAVSISLERLIKGQPPVNNIIAREGFIRILEYPDSTNNFSFLLKTGAVQSRDVHIDNIPPDFYKIAGRLWKRFFSVSDFNFNITEFILSWGSPAFKEYLKIDELILNNTLLQFAATDITGDAASQWNATGIIDPSEEIIQIKGNTANGKSNEIPFFEKITGTRFFIHSFTFSAEMDQKKRDSLMFNVTATAIAPGLNHWRISPDEVVLDSMHARLNIIVKKNEIKSDSKSVIIINRMPIVTEMEYMKKDSTLLAVKLNIDDIHAQQFFNSLPKGLFAELEGIKVKGSLDYNLNFRVNLNNPDNLVFESVLKKSKFSISEYGNENFAAINDPFMYTIREKDVVVRVLNVGPDNPNFVALGSINPFLVHAVLTAEDGTFFFHRGFNEEAFRQSIATNIKEKRFARGGSTITMQLVKNVFLNRNKTVSRKVEEALIVWLIENNRLVSKERLLEVYLNIIEWGPGVYGIGEAAEFYFAKHPSQLTLEESIYLSSIIPRPKTFRYTFDKEGKMKEYLKGYFNLVAGRLLKKEIITQELLDSLQFHIELKGPALLMVLPADSIPADSLLREENEEVF